MTKSQSSIILSITLLAALPFFVNGLAIAYTLPDLTGGQTPDEMLVSINQALGNDPVANQKIADAREEAQIQQWNTDAEKIANGTMPVCKQGQTPISDWLDSLNQTQMINGSYHPIYESCVEPKSNFTAAIILLP